MNVHAINSPTVGNKLINMVASGCALVVLSVFPYISFIFHFCVDLI